uniref:Uncharacterized protein n=1 Tax=Arundo donax TaxID=35708 RepID=A0A0A9BX41_ARUDO
MPFVGVLSNPQTSP